MKEVRESISSVEIHTLSKNPSSSDVCVCYSLLCCLLGVYQIARMEGGRQGKEERVRSIQRELQGELYRDAERRHKDMLVMLRVCVYACTGDNFLCIYIYMT